VTERLARGAPGLCVVMTMVLRAAQLKEGRRSVLPVVAYVKPWIA